MAIMSLVHMSNTNTNSRVHQMVQAYAMNELKLITIYNKGMSSN